MILMIIFNFAKRGSSKKYFIIPKEMVKKMVKWEKKAHTASMRNPRRHLLDELLLVLKFSWESFSGRWMHTRYLISSLLLYRCVSFCMQHFVIRSDDRPLLDNPLNTRSESGSEWRKIPYRWLSSYTKSPLDTGRWFKVVTKRRLMTIFKLS